MFVFVCLMSQYQCLTKYKVTARQCFPLTQAAVLICNH